MQHYEPSLHIVVTGGGTGGHVSPILAVIDELRARTTTFTPLWIGSRNGSEREAAAEYGIPYKAVAVGKLRRYVSLRTIPDAARVPLGVVQSIPALRRFEADVIFSTGGYVGVPAVVAGKLLRVPSLTHEQTASLGLATRINARFSDTIALSHHGPGQSPEIRSNRVIVTGNPIRSWLRNGQPERAATAFKLAGGFPLLYVTGGAQGALAINDAVGAALPELLDVFEIVHQTGQNHFNGSYERLTAMRSALPKHLRDRYHLTERVGPELADLYAAADIVLGRSGAGTVAELAALGLPSVLVPLPGAAEQRENARLLEATGAALVIEQDRLTPERLHRQLTPLAGSGDRLASMGTAARSSVGAGDPAALLVDEILRLARKKRASLLQTSQRSSA